MGIALDKGYIKDVNQPVLDFFPERTIANSNAQKQSMTLKHLLTMTSGLDTKDTKRDKLKGLAQMMNSEDWVKYVLDLPMAQQPGKFFKYSNGVSHLIGAILQKATSMTAINFAKDHLFTPLNIHDVKWEQSPGGINLGFIGIMLKPHDMAKFGLLLLNNGQWEDKQIVSRSWVEDATWRNTVNAPLFGGYGYQWCSERGKYYAAMGIMGQFIFVVPDKNMVVVFTGNFDNNIRFYSIVKSLMDNYIMMAAVSSEPLAANPKNKKHLNTLITNASKAPEKGFIWMSKKEGVAKNGEFVRKKSPSFQFEYPKISYKIRTTHPGQVMAMKTLNGNYIASGVGEISPDIKLAEVGPNVVTDILKKLGSNIQVISNKKIRLKDGTAAYRTDIDWQSQNFFKFRTLVVSAFKSKKWVAVGCTLDVSNEASISENLKEGTSIIESLTFK